MIAVISSDGQWGLYQGLLDGGISFDDFGGGVGRGGVWQWVRFLGRSHQH